MRLMTLGLWAALISLPSAGIALAQPQEAPAEVAKQQPWKKVQGTFTFEGQQARVRVRRADRSAGVVLSEPGGSVTATRSLTLSPDLLEQLDLAISRSRAVRWAWIGPTSSEALIRRLQSRLAAKGYAIQPSGTYDEATQAALEEFQEHQFLQVSRWADEKTRRRLDILPAGGGFVVDERTVRGRRLTGVLGVIARSAQLGSEPIRHRVSGRVAPTSGREVELHPQGGQEALVVGFLHAGYEKAVPLLREGTFELLTWRGEGEVRDRHLIARVYVEATPESLPEGVELGQPLEVVALTEVPTRTLEPLGEARTVGGAAFVVRDAQGRKGRIDHPAALRAARLEGAVSALSGLGKIR